MAIPNTTSLDPGSYVLRIYLYIYIYLICIACLSTLWLSPNIWMFACSCFCHPKIVIFATKDQTPLNGQLRQGSYSGTFGGATEHEIKSKHHQQKEIMPFKGVAVAV